MTEGQAETFAGMLRRLRMAAGLSQEALAERAGLTAAAVGALERGERTHPYPHTVQVLSDALGLSQSEQRRLAAAVPARTTGPARTLAGAPAAVSAPPSPLTPLIGRGQDVARVVSLVRDEGARLVTITGTGGVGKTRLALEVAHALAAGYPAGVAWVELAALDDASMVMPAIARSLAIPEAPGTTTEQLLATHLRHRRLLIVLDNLEHVIGAARAIVGLLENCPGLTALVTSREALRVRGEHEIRLAPLKLPATAEPVELRQSDAVQLFLARARTAIPDFELDESNGPAISELCRRLDGLPLALEVAAAQLKYLPVAMVLQHVAQGGAGPGEPLRDLPQRQQSLDATLAWSHALLGDGERVLFRRLAVFPGSFAADAATAICADASLPRENVLGTLTALVNKSLLQAHRDAEARFAMLETVRAFARTRLNETDDEPRLRARHADYYAAVASEAEPGLRGASSPQSTARLEQDSPNFTAAMEWATTKGEPCAAMRLAGALRWFWLTRGWIADAHRWTQRLLAEPRPACPPADTARVLHAAAAIAWKRGELERARKLADESAETCRSLGDSAGLAFALAICGLVAVSQQRPADAVECHEQSLSLFEQCRDRWGAGYARSNLGDALFALGESAAAREHYEAALAAFRAEKDAWGEAIVLHTLGNIALRERDFITARERYAASAALSASFGNAIEMARALLGRAAAALALGDLDSAHDDLVDSLEVWDGFDNDDGVALCLTGLAAIASQRGDGDEALALLRRSRERCPQPSVYVVDTAFFDPYLTAAREALGEA